MHYYTPKYDHAYLERYGSPFGFRQLSREVDCQALFCSDLIVQGSDSQFHIVIVEFNKFQLLLKIFIILQHTSKKIFSIGQ